MSLEGEKKFSEKPRFLCQWVLNISPQQPTKLHVFGQPTFDNMLSQGPPPKRIYILTIFQKQQIYKAHIAPLGGAI